MSFRICSADMRIGLCNGDFKAAMAGQKTGKQPWCCGQARNSHLSTMAETGCIAEMNCNVPAWH